MVDEKMNPKVSIIILNWNGWKDTIECLESLYQITYPNYDVIVVDNGSEDESIEKIKGYAEGKIEVKSNFFEYDSGNKPIKIIEYTREEAEAGGCEEKEFENLPSDRKLIIIKNEKNYGFAEGSNIGMRYALKALNSDYFLLLNNDTVVDKEFLGELVKVGESGEKIGIVGPRIYYYNEPERIQSMGGNMRLCTYQIHYTINYKSNNVIKVDMVNGAAFLIKKNVIQTVGLLDPDYFVYAEETDFCIRAKKHGLCSVCAPNSKVWHKIYSSSGGKVNPTLIYYWTRNPILFYRKNYKYYLIIAFPVFSTRYLFRIGVNILKGDYRMIKGIIYGFIDGIKGRTGMLTRHL